MSPVPPRYFEVLITFQFYLRPVVEGCCWALILMAVLGWRGEESKKDESTVREIGAAKSAMRVARILGEACEKHDDQRGAS